MASATTASLEEMKRRVREKVEQLRKDTLNVLTVSEDPVLHDDEMVNSLMKTKLQLESEIEATMEEGLLELPEDNNLLVALAKEDAESMANNNARTLEAYKEKIRQLEEEKMMYKSLLGKATLVDGELNKLIANQTKKDKLDMLQRRYENSGVLFKAMRSELQYTFSDLFPEKSDGLSMENVLEKLVSQLLNNVQDPYITVDEDIPESYIAFLLRANLIIRHPNDVLRIKFTDPRN